MKKPNEPKMLHFLYESIDFISSKKLENLAAILFGITVGRV